MSNIDLEGLSLDDLPYPMFETTEEEKDCLWEALPHISDEDNNYFICLTITEVIKNPCGRPLRGKIEKALEDHYTLADYLGLGDFIDPEMQAELRRIWIRKLLEYAGDLSPSSVA